MNLHHAQIVISSERAFDPQIFRTILIINQVCLQGDLMAVMDHPCCQTTEIIMPIIQPLGNYNPHARDPRYTNISQVECAESGEPQTQVLRELI